MTGNELPKINAIDMLYSFCDEFPIDPEVDSVKVLLDAGHLHIAEAINKVFLLRKDAKKHCIWIYGEGNSGKTSSIECMEEIFCT
jgi:hypothetical protein